MKILFVTLLAVAAAQAQSILKVEGNKVTVTGASFENGQNIRFLDSELEVKATGVVEKASPQGKTAIVKIKTGQVKTAYTFEAVGAEMSVEQKAIVSASLSEEDRKILDRGEIGTLAYVLGGVLGTYPVGLGIGHAVQGRYSDKGWIFTVGEIGSVAVAVAGIEQCTTTWYGLTYSCKTNALFAIGIISYVGFRVWEAIDVWAAPPEHNRRYRELRARTSTTTFRPFLVPIDGGLQAGFRYTF